MQHILNGQGFSPPQLAQVTLVSQAYWGATFAALLGLSFTSLTVATMVLSLSGTITFYVILRRLGFSAILSSVGTTAFACNPQYLSLSYSFMSDVIFLALLLLGCLSYIEGLTGAEGWLWFGSALAASAFLTRQYGLVLPVAALLWLLVAHQLTLRRLFAVALLPTLVAISYLAWRNGFSPTIADSYQQKVIAALIQNPTDEVSNRVLGLLVVLPIMGLAIPLLSLIRRWWLLIGWLALIGSVAYLFLQGRSDTIGSLRSEIDAGPPGLAGSALWWLAVILAAWQLSILSERVLGWLHHLRARQQPTPADFLYFVAIIFFIGAFFTTGVIYVRYLLPFVPFIIVVLLRPLQGRSLRQLTPILVALALVISYSIVTHLDEYSYGSVRWQAGDSLLAQGIANDKIDNGYTWDGYYFYDEAVRRLNAHDLDLELEKYAPYLVIDPQYIVAIHPQPGYTVLREYPYFSISNNFTTHYVFVMRRNSP